MAIVGGYILKLNVFLKKHDVVALRGEEARKVFFDTKSLDFIEGYKILMGAVSSFFVNLPTLIDNSH